MFAIAAAILFGVAFILDIADQAGDLISTLTVGGLLCIALHLAVGPIITLRRQP
jgi:hypothetical protein